MPADPLAGDSQCFFEGRGVAPLDFEKVDTFIGIEIVQPTHSFIGLVERFRRFVSRLTGNEPDELVFIFGEESLCLLIEVDTRNAQLGRARGPRDEGRGDDRKDEERGNLKALRALKDVGKCGVDKNKRNEKEWPAQRVVSEVDGNRDGSGSNQDQDTSRVGAPLRIDISVKEPGDYERDGDKDEHERTIGARPLRRHAEAWEIARDEVQQAGHGGCAGEGKDEDGADVVYGTEGVAEILMSEVSERAAVRLTSLLELVW